MPIQDGYEAKQAEEAAPADGDGPRLMTRRALIKAGWVAPVVLAVGLTGAGNVSPPPGEDDGERAPGSFRFDPDPFEGEWSHPNQAPQRTPSSWSHEPRWSEGQWSKDRPVQ